MRKMIPKKTERKCEKEYARITEEEEEEFNKPNRNGKEVPRRGEHIQDTECM